MSTILQVQVIDRYWTDKAYDNGLAWRSHSPNLSVGAPNLSVGAPGAIPDYSWSTGGVVISVCLFAMSEMQCIVYMLQYKVVTLLQPVVVYYLAMSFTSLSL